MGDMDIINLIGKKYLIDGNIVEIVSCDTEGIHCTSYPKYNKDDKVDFVL